MVQVTYLGRSKETLLRDKEGDVIEPDIYRGFDHAVGETIAAGVGDTIEVSADKAAQLEADYPDEFEIGDSVDAGNRNGSGEAEELRAQLEAVQAALRDAEAARQAAKKNAGGKSKAKESGKGS
jgi:hypothetical protein